MGAATELKSLARWNQQRAAEIDAVERAERAPVRNGLACPTCGVELFDTKPLFTFREGAGPQQLQVHCDQCGFTGARVDG